MKAPADGRIPGQSPVPRPPGTPRVFTFRRRHRLTHAREFDAAFAAKLRKSAGPLTVFLNPTDRPEPRLGLSIGRRIGNAVARNHLKRRIRDAFRLVRTDLPTHDSGCYDIVVAARAHRPLDAADYQRCLTDAIARAHREHLRRLRRTEGES